MSNEPTSQEQLDQQLRDRLHSVFPNPQVANRLIDLAVNKRPEGWSKKSQAPYYKEIYANMLKKDIDAMLLSREDIVYLYNSWCGLHREIMSEKTLYNRVNQSRLYLLKFLDPNGVYWNWYQIVRIEQERSLGVTIRFIEEFRNGSPDSQFKAATIISREDVPKWKQKMEEWLEGDSEVPFILEGLCLTPEEVNTLKLDLSLLSGIACSITAVHIKIVRTLQ